VEFGANIPELAPGAFWSRAFILLFPGRFAVRAELLFIRPLMACSMCHTLQGGAYAQKPEEFFFRKFA
jgi:hypothetical protein